MATVLECEKQIRTEREIIVRMEWKKQNVEKVLDDEIKVLKSTRGRSKYYPHNLDEWRKVLDKTVADRSKTIESRERAIDAEIVAVRATIAGIQKRMEGMMDRGPVCAVCLDDKYAETPTDGRWASGMCPISFNRTACKTHVFHRECVPDSVKKCPLCRHATKRLAPITKAKLTRLIAPAPSVAAPKPKADVTKVPATECVKGVKGVKCVKATRCKNGTRKNKNTGECEPVRARTHTQIASVAAPLPQSTPMPAVRVRRCKNGTRKNKNTGECEPKST